jgi:hypothetical protein
MKMNCVLREVENEFLNSFLIAFMFQNVNCRVGWVGVDIGGLLLCPFMSKHMCPAGWEFCWSVTTEMVESSWNAMAHGGTGRWSEGENDEWSGYPVLFTLPRNMMYPALLLLMNTPRLPVVNWTDAPADLNGFACFAERRNLVSARVPSYFKRSLHVRCCIELRLSWKYFIMMNTRRGFPLKQRHPRDDGDVEK